MTLWMVAMALAAPDGDLCTELRRANPRADVVRSSLEAGADPDALCRWTTRVPLISTFPGVVFAVVAPPIGIPVGVTEKVTKRRKALPLSLAVDSGSAEVVGLLLDHGAKLYGGAVDDAVGHDDWPVAERLLAAGASPTLRTLGQPLAGDVDRLDRARDLGLRLDEVHILGESWTLRTDPAVASAFLDAGLPPELLLVEAADVGGSDVVALCVGRTDPVSRPAVRALEEAVRDRRWDLVDLLLEAGVPIDPVERGPCLLCDAVADGSTSATRELLARGASPRARSYGAPPLAQAADRGRLDLVDLLLEAGAEPREGMPSAVAAGRWTVVDRLVDAGARIDEPGVLTVAVRTDRADAVQGLLRRGVPADARVGDGTWVTVAVSSRRPDRVAELVEAGGAIDGLTLETSPLQVAADTGRAELVRVVLDLGADPAALPDPVRAWDRTHSDEVRQTLLDAGVAPSPRALLDVVRDGEVHRIERYLAAGADPDGRSSTYGDHPLEAARSREVEDLLLGAGAHPPADWLEDLWEAGDRGRIDEVLAVSDTDARALSARVLEDAVDAGDVEAVGWLLERGGSPDARTFLGDPVLWVALESGDGPVARRLLQAGADASGVYRRDAALTLAMENGLLELVEPLARAGADLQPEDVWTTPERAALRAGDGAVSALLDAGHPVTVELLRHQAEACDLEGLMAHRDRWPEELSKGAVRWAGRRGGCGREVRGIVRGR